MSVARLAFTWILCLFWSAVTVVHLIVQWFKHRETFFRKEDHPKPSVLDGWTHETVQLSDVKLHYVESGDMDKPLLLFIHGFPEFWYSWRYQIRHFEKDYHVVAVDLRGYNESERPEGLENYKSSLIAKDIKELIAALNHEKGILVAHDWGGAIAWRVTVTYPEVVDKLIVLNCPHPLAFRTTFRTLSQLIKSWYMFMFQMPYLAEFAWEVNDFKMLKGAFRGRNAGIKNRENFTDQDEEAWLYTYSKPGAFTGPINFYRAGFQFFEKFDETRIKAKTLIIWGTEDSFLDKASADLSTKYCEIAELRSVEGASHWVQQDNPEKVNLYIEQFLAHDQ